MKQIGDVLVIGAGVIGAAIAFALTRAGNLRVTLLEKGPLAAGMTRRSAGLVHPFQAHPTLIQFALDSYAFYARAAELLGANKSEFVSTGAALLGGATDAAKIFAHAQMFASDAREVTTLARGALAAQYPGVSPQLYAGLFTPRAGYADAAQMTQRLTQAARQRGLTIATGAQVKQILLAQGRVRGALTTAGEYEAPLVIVAAGGWTDKTLATIGLTTQLQFQRGAILFYEQPPNMTQGHPLFWDVNGEFFLRPHPYHLSAAGMLSPQPQALQFDALDEYVAPDIARDVSEFVARCWLTPSAPPKRAHTIVYSVGAGGLPMLGQMPGAAGLFVAAGFGANAFAVAPAVGETIARMVTDTSAPSALSFFQPARAKDNS